MNTVSKTAKQVVADIVIIGGGGSGITAAVAVAEAGVKKIVILEKTDKLGGNAYIGGGIFGAETPAQQRLGIKVSADKLFQDKMQEAEWKIDPRITRDLINRSAFIFQWMEDKGVKSNHIIAMGVAHTSEEEVPAVFHLLKPTNPNDFHTTFLAPKFIDRLLVDCEKFGVQILRETTAQKILTDKEGQISGVMAQTKGQEIHITAKSVIIAAGGFGGNMAMVEEYFPTHGKIFSNSLTQMTGDGIRMAIEAGALKDDEVGLFLIGPCHYPWADSLTVFLRRPHVMLVNKKCERYIAESSQKGGNNALDRQPDKICYAILDSELYDDTINKNELFSNAEKERGTWQNQLQQDFLKDAAEGHAKIADTLEEVAEYIGAKPEVLKATIERYNSFCDKGYDVDFLKEKKYLIPVRKPPYYVILGHQGFDTTYGGIKINERMEVIGKNGEPINGLYASGDNAAGCLSIAYMYSGSANGFTFYSGYTAGSNAAKYVSNKS
jgi:fumarate reductase flavoprotein subunit